MFFDNAISMSFPCKFIVSICNLFQFVRPRFPLLPFLKDLVVSRALTSNIRLLSSSGKIATSSSNHFISHQRTKFLGYRHDVTDERYMLKKKVNCYCRPLC